MSHIIVNFNQLQEVGQICSVVSNKILGAKEDFQAAISKLDWEVRAEKNISTRSVRIIHKVKQCGNDLGKYKSFIDNAYNQYAALENYREVLSSVGNITPYSANSDNTNSNSNSVNDLIKDEWKKTEYSLDITSKLLSFLKRYTDREIADGILGDLLGFIVTISEACREGFENVTDACSFVLDGSSDLISLITDFIEKGDFKNTGIVVSELSMISELLSAGSKLTDLLTKDLGEAFQDAGGLLASGGKIIKEALKQFVTKFSGKEVAKEITKEVTGKVIEPLVAFGSACTRFVGDVFTFAKDGDYTIQDFSRTLLDSGLSGASSWIKSLTCGLIDVKVDKTGDYIMDACNSVHDYMEKNNWPTWAKITGSIIGAPITFSIGIGNMIKGKQLA